MYGNLKKSRYRFSMARALLLSRGFAVVLATTACQASTTEAADAGPMDPRSPQAWSEREKIDALLQRIEQSELVFIRNGREHSAREAASHLREKLARAKGARPLTARDFIERLASASSTTGQPYSIRKPDGETLPAGTWLMAELEALEHTPHGRDANSASDLDGREAIEAILERIASSNATFEIHKSDDDVKRYDGKHFVRHLRRKWFLLGRDVPTSAAWLEAVATRSSRSGRPYRVRRSDGAVIDLRTWLEEPP